MHQPFNLTPDSHPPIVTLTKQDIRLKTDKSKDQLPLLSLCNSCSLSAAALLSLLLSWLIATESCSLVPAAASFPSLADCDTFGVQQQLPLADCNNSGVQLLPLADCDNFGVQLRPLLPLANYNIAF